jgi:hypothetical protein
MESDDVSKGRSRFNFYLVALNFSILGLALQTYKSEKGVFGTPWEPLAWTFLLISGLFALSYVERASIKVDLNTIREKLLRSPAPVGEHLKSLEDEKTYLTQVFSRTNPSDGTKYWIAKWGFTAGVLALALSRTIKTYF